MTTTLFEQTGHIGILTINRPEALNALNSTVVTEVTERLNQLARMDLRCLIITGAGEKAFVAGADIREMLPLSPSEAAIFSDHGNAMMEQVEDFPCPVIAAVNGFALGGGCELALSCDIRLASANAVFGLPETKLGIIPGYGGLQRLARIVGMGKAREIAFTATNINAEDARALGLVNAVLPLPELMTGAMAMAEKIAANAPVAVREAKKVFKDAIGLTLLQARRLERESFGHCFTTSDQRMAMNAFIEKRKPEPFAGK